MLRGLGVILVNTIINASYTTYHDSQFQLGESHPGRYDLFCFREGSARVKGRHGIYRATPGDCLLFCENEAPHTVYSNGQSVSLYRICFEPDTALIIKENHITANPATSAAVRRCFEHHDFGNKPEAACWLAAAVCEFCNPSLVCPNSELELLDALISYLTAHFQEKLSLEKLCVFSGYSANHITRIFNKQLGCTPYQYLLAFRCKRAENLLKLTDKSVAEIALETGFNDSAHFSKSFKRFTGRLPSSYRKPE